MKRVLVIGSGAGGATIARELQGTFEVTVLEQGHGFKPFLTDLNLLAKMRATKMFFDPREIQLLFPSMQVRRTPDAMYMVNGRGLGGTTTLSAGNALRVDKGLKEIGIDLDLEFEEVYAEIPISSNHQDRWRESTRALFEICEKMGLNPSPLPKLGDYTKCTRCGRCVLGCEAGAKWDSRVFLEDAVCKGAQIISGCSVTQVVIEKGQAVGVKARKGALTKFYPADLVILAAGGFSTPVILQNSGIECTQDLFVDPVLCVAARMENAFQNKELSMPFVVQQEGYIVSPYFDYLSFFFNKEWRHEAKDILPLMIKLADSNKGSVEGKPILKTLTMEDKAGLQRGVELCTEILEHAGAQKDSIFLGTVNAGHPGGMLPLTSNEAESFHSPRLPENLYVADASLFNTSLGNPPILTIVALAKRIAKVIDEGFSEG